MAKKKELSAAEIAAKLMEARQAINEWKAIEKPLADQLKKMIKAGEKQDQFKITSSFSFKIEDRVKAMEWAKKYAEQTIVVDATAARRVFLQDAATGSMGTAESNGFILKETEKLSAIGERDEE